MLLDVDLLKVFFLLVFFLKVCNIFYYIFDIFFDKWYGYLELLSEDVDKFRKKFNGLILWGVKICIECVKFFRILEFFGDEVMVKEQKDKRVKDDVYLVKYNFKKRKCDNDEISGIVFDNDRKVKRGWIIVDEFKEKRLKKDSKDKKKKQE